MATESPDKTGAKRGSVVDMFSKGLGIAKQWALQKMDKAAPTEETKDFKEKVKHFEDNRLALDELNTRAGAWLTSLTASNAAFADFSSSTAKLGSHLTAEAKIAAVVQAFVPYALKLQGLHTKFSDTYRDLVTKPLQTLMNTEVKQAVSLLKQLDVDRLDYDARRSKVEKLNEKPGEEAEKKLASEKENEARLEYEHTKSQLLALFEVVETRKNLILQQQLALLVKAQQQLFLQSEEAARGSQIDWEALAPKGGLVELPKGEEKASRTGDYHFVPASTDPDESGDPGTAHAASASDASPTSPGATTHTSPAATTDPPTTDEQ